jgi:hypothetical protein
MCLTLTAFVASSMGLKEDENKRHVQLINGIVVQ